MDLLHPPAEVHVDADLVRALLRSQQPALSDVTLTLVDEGWDNVTFRAGRRHAVRLPRREAAVPLLLNEARWLPDLSAGLPLAVPRPVFLGAPDDTYRWPWAVVEWVEGTTVDEVPLRSDQVERIVDFLTALHHHAPDAAPVSAVRGTPLEASREVVEGRIQRSGRERLRRVWTAALAAQPSAERRWLHGDLHARNVLAVDGRVSGVLDWGDVTAGDVATDLASAWLLFDDASARRALLDRYGASDETRARAAGWAVNFAASLVVSGEPRHAAMGEVVADRLEQDFC